MRTNFFKLSSMHRSISQALIITFITLLCLPSARLVSAREHVPARNTLAAPLAGLIVVNVTNDADNLDPNAGCDTDAATPGEQCSLRAAIQRANALAGDDEIGFNIPSTQPNCDSSVGHCAINLTQPLPLLATNILIKNPNPGLVTVRRLSATDFRLFTVIGAGEVTFSGLRMTSGRPAGISTGGAIANTGDATVNVIDCVFTDNFAGATGGSGGAISNDSGGTVNVVNSVLIDNRGTAAGGAIYNGGSGTVNVTSSIVYHNTIAAPVATGLSGGGAIANDANGTLNITNSAIGDNIVTRATGSSSPLAGGGVWNIGNGLVNVTGSVIYGNFLAFGNGGGISNAAGTLFVRNSTITGNRGVGGGIQGQSTVQSSIIAKNNAGPGTGSDVSGSFTSQGFNFIGVEEGSTGFTIPSDLKGTIAAPLDPKFDPNGVSLTGFVLPVPGLPLCGSPVIDKGTSNGLSTDLRGTGFPRTIDDPDEANASDGTDIGAFERQTVCADIAFTVNTTSDADDVNPGDGNCDSDAGAPGAQCSLRAALKESNAIASDYTINFAIPTNDPGFDPGTGRHTINLTAALPEVTNSNLTINGPGKDRLTVRRNTGGFYRIFTFGGVVESLTISGMTISNAFNSMNDGGGLSFNGKTLNVQSCVFSNNIAAWSGGAIFAFGKLTVTDSTFSNNFSSNQSGGGGAIRIAGDLNVANSTFIDNIANGLGGGISAGGVTGESSITNSTFTGNSADAGGGIAVATNTNAAMRITNSRFTRNISSLVNSRGGAIYHSFGTLHLTGSTLTNNESYGLAISMGTGANVTNVTDTVISGNTLGGIETEDATASSSQLNITNSTISGNTGGPGVSLSRVTLNVSNSTISHNETVGIRQTISSNQGVWTVRSSIIAGNGGFSDVSGPFTSVGFNLIGKADGATGFTNGVNNDQVGTTASPVDPKLDPMGLKDNGGATHTIALQPDSPAIDKGSADGLRGKIETDQRGVFARTYDDPAISNAGDGTDIGAFELQPGGPTPTPSPTPTPDPSPSPSPTPNPSPSPSPTPTPTPEPARVVVTVTSLVRSNCGSIAVGVTVQNAGGVTANNVTLTTGTLTQPTSTIGTPLPQGLGNLAPGQWATRVITFSGTNNAPGQKRTLTFGGSFNGGTFSQKWKVTLP